jgi:hypothetical protein
MWQTTPLAALQDPSKTCAVASVVSRTSPQKGLPLAKRWRFGATIPVRRPAYLALPVQRSSIHTDPWSRAIARRSA